jgi:hypothetical protein
MLAVSASTKASAEDLWALLSDLDNWADLLPTMQQVTRVRDGPIGVGGRFEVRQPGLPKAEYEITHWEPGRGFTWVSSAVGVRTTASHRLDAEPEATTLVLSIEWSGPLAWLARLVAGSKARRMVEQEAETFVRLAERAERGR